MNGELQASISDQLKKKNFGLEENEFYSLVKELQNGNDEIFERIYFNHFDYCLRFLMNHQGAKYEDAYTCTMNALLEIRKDLISGKIEYGNLSYYFTYRANKKYYKLNNRANNKLKIVHIENMDFTDDSDFLQKLESKEITDNVKLAMSKLKEECRHLLRLYYYDGLSWAKVARVYFPDADPGTLITKGDTLKKRNKRKCLPAFKAILKKIMG